LAKRFEPEQLADKEAELADEEAELHADTHARDGAQGRIADHDEAPQLADTLARDHVHRAGENGDARAGLGLAAAGWVLALGSTRLLGHDRRE
jgi:hypothetical protein